MLSFTEEAYVRFYDFLQPYAKDFPEPLRREFFPPEDVQAGSPNSLNQRITHGAWRVYERVVLPWHALDSLVTWLDKEKQGRKARTAIEQALSEKPPATIEPPAGKPPPPPVPPAPPKAPADPVPLPTLRKEPTPMEQFVRAFLQQASQNDGIVGKRVLGDLIREHGAPTAQVLAKEGWIVGIVAPGRSKIGTYRAGPKMEAPPEAAQPLPDDPLQRARLLVGQKPELEARRLVLQAALEECDAQLGRIEQAEKLIAQLSELMK